MAQQFWTFCLVSVVGIAITSALSDLTLGLLHALAGTSLELAGIGVPSVFAAHAVAVGVTVLYSFPAHKILSFNVGIRGQLMHVSGQLRGRT